MEPSAAHAAPGEHKRNRTQQYTAMPTATAAHAETDGSALRRAQTVLQVATMAMAPSERPRGSSAKQRRVELGARSIGARSSEATADLSAESNPLGSLTGSQRVTYADLQALRRGASAGSTLGQGEYALRPTDETLIPRMLSELRAVHTDSQNQGTLAKDMGHWNQYWEPICRLFNTRPIRDAPGAATGSDVDAQEADIALFCFALILIMSTMQPKKKTAPAARPGSGFQVLLAIRRIHLLLGVLLIPLKFVRLTLKGLLQRFVRAHGHEALLPDRKWPIPHSVFVQLLRLTSVSYGATRWTASSLLGKSTLAMICLLYASGFRKAEITDHGAGLTYLTRSSVRWVIAGVAYSDPSIAMLAKRGVGTYAEVLPRQSKCDFTGEVWGDKPTFHHWAAAEGNACEALAQLELACPVHGVERRTFPLFCEDDGSAVSETRAARLLDAMLLLLMSASMAAHYTWHSFRHSLATRLRKAKCPADIIMQMCRWQTIQSLRTYARLDASQQQMWHEASFDIAFTEGPSEENIDSAHLLSQLDQDPTWDRDDGHRHTLATPQRPAAAGAPAPPTAAAPLTRDNAPRRLVLVPRSRYPRNACTEHGGRGWEAQVVSATGVTALVRYLRARAADGRPYADTREPLSSLEPLD